ncbi:MAG TPA: amino acid adenylation domain-containing protein [Pyrinomonadaceae bacterium]|jgi:amino acid adenylation domain-containing protein
MTEEINGFRLSPQQERLWSLQQEQGGRPYISQAVVAVSGPLDDARLRAALLRVVERHEILRTNFKLWAGMNVPLQTISAPAVAWAEPVDLSGADPDEQGAGLRALARQERLAPRDIERGPVLRAGLARLSPSEHRLILTLPALCADEKTFRNMARQLRDAYDESPRVEARDGEPLQYVELSQWWHEAFASDDAQAGREFWRRCDLSRLDSVALPFEKRAAAHAPFDPETLSLEVPDGVARKLEALAQSWEHPQAALLLGCWQVLWRRSHADAKLPTGVAFDGRNYPELESALGLLAALLPVPAEVADETPLREVVGRAAEALDEAAQWQDCFRWADAAPTRGAARAAVFLPVCFEFEERLAEPPGGDVAFAVQSRADYYDRFKIKLSCVRAGDSLLTEFHYDASAFDRKSVRCLAARFHTLLASVARRPEAKAGEFEMIGAQERELLARYNATRAELAHGLCFHNLFELQAARTPDAPALVFGGGQTSYAQLNAAANSLAHHLIAAGVGPEHRVALCLERSPKMVVALLGVLKAGAAYLPLEPRLPANRLRFILDDAGAAVVLTEEGLRPLVPERTDVPVWSLDGEWPLISRNSQENPPPRASPDNLAYVIYTSGSTGAPKGVMIPHRGLRNYLGWAEKAYNISAGSRSLVHSSFGFDLTVTSLLLPLAAGGTVELTRPGDELEQLCEALSDPARRYALLKLTPSHLRVLGGWLGEQERFGRVEALVIGGEALPSDVLNVWRQRSSETRLINEYGPTETVVGCSTFEVPPGACDGEVPIGRPVGNMRMYVLDESLRPVPAGAAGEIYIGGEGVARGYLSRPALTAERFLPDPFSGEPGERLYRSGDLGRLRADGELEYLGRADEQVKLLGYRVELGEIEAALRRHPAVRESAVALHGDRGEKRLVGYVVLRDDGGHMRPGAAATELLRAYLRDELPDYMIPAHLKVLPRMPLTHNGKIDRHALPAPEREVYADDGEGANAALSPVERQLAAIWAELLNLSHIDVDDNFFSLGGDSILAMQVAFKARQTGLELHPLQLFRYPTVARLAAVLTADKAPGPAAPAPAAVNARPPAGLTAVPSLNQNDLEQILRKLSK